MYSGSPPRGWNRDAWGFDKRRTAVAFREGEMPALATTKAFGMGIDIPNIRYTVHFGIPGSIESFYQEAGRAAATIGYRRGVLCCSRRRRRK